MTDDQTYLNAVADTLERLQIKPADLFAYVEGLRARYTACHDALRNIMDFSDDEEVVRDVARSALSSCNYMEDVSHETN